MNATLPLGNSWMYINRAWLRAEPHCWQNRAHLLDLGKSNFVLSRNLADAIFDLGWGLMEKSSMNSVRIFGNFARFRFWLFWKSFKWYLKSEEIFSLKLEWNYLRVFKARRKWVYYSKRFTFKKFLRLSSPKIFF